MMIAATQDLIAGDVFAIKEPCFVVLDKIAFKFRLSLGMF